jgi:CIC family chloride channel protein
MENMENNEQTTEDQFISAVLEEEQEVEQTEVQEFLDARQQRRWIFPRAALVGLLAGLVALAFRILLVSADTFRNNLINWTHQFPIWGWIVPILLSAGGAILAVLLTKKFAPETAGSGIPHLESVLLRFRELRWKRVLPVKFVGGIIAIGSGLTLGREGPTVQMGGSIGAAVAKLLKTTEREKSTLISAGAGAGLAAAFNAPLSGLIFVLEEVRRDFQPIVFGATFVAAVIADIIARIGTGQFPVFTVPNYSLLSLSTLPIFALLGIIAGIFGVLFNKGLLKSLDLFSVVPKKYKFHAIALAGGVIGLTGWFLPQSIGSGHTLAESVLKGDIALPMILLFFAIRFLFTITSYGTGAPGGIFAPLLVLGSLIGLAVGQGAHLLIPSVVPTPGVFAVVGMAAMFTAIVRAPLTGIMLIIEMTGSYSQMLPLLVSSFAAYAVAEYMKDLPIYESLMRRDLHHTNIANQLEQPAVLEFIVQAGAPFIGMQVRDLGLPPGCILVRCADGKKEWVPKATTRIEPHMRLSAVIAPEAQNAVGMLHRGCTAHQLAFNDED